MHILLAVIIILLNLSIPEPQLGYWICDIIKNTKAVDFVILPNSIFQANISCNNDSLVITNLDNKQLDKLLSKNFSLYNLIPISGFVVRFDTFNNIKITPNVIKEKYTLITTKSLNPFDKANIINENIVEIINAYLQNSSYISFPNLNRYVYPELKTSTDLLKINEQSKIDINTASKELLESLPGIGPKTAQQIIDYRNEHGLFKSVEQIIEVKGIGPKKYSDIKNLITI